jgi:hypothetical protein
VNNYQLKRIERSEQLILLHCQLMRRPRPDSTLRRLVQQTRAAFFHLFNRGARHA